MSADAAKPRVGGCGRAAAKLLSSARAAFAACAMALFVCPAVAQAQDSAVQQVSAPTLTRIIFLPRAEDLAAAGPPTQGPQIDSSRVPALSDPAAAAVLSRFLGRELDSALVEALRAAVSDYYGRIGRPFVQVVTPRQDVTSGVLQVLVIEARLGEVTVEGARWFGPDQYLRKLRLQPGEPIDSLKLQADLDWLNRNAYRHAAVLAAPGKQTGETDLIIRTQERLPLSASIGFDNTGTRASGLARTNAGIDWGNAFWRGDGLNYQVVQSSSSTAVRQHALTYTGDLPWRHTLILAGIYAKTHSLGDGFIGATGVGKIASLRYIVPAPPRGRFVQRFAFGYDYKSSNNNILFGGINVFPTTSEVHQFAAEYAGQAPDRFGATTFTLTFVASPGRLSARNTDAAFQSQQLGARTQYAYARALVARATPLPRQLVWNARLIAQVSSGNLLPSEQILFGGVQSVRGFVEQGAARDQGLIFQNEVRAPPRTVELPKSLHRTPVTVTPFWFVDGAVGRNTKLRDRTGVTLVSTGPGVEWQVARHVTARASWGVPLMREGATGGRLPVQFGIQVKF